MVQPSTEPLADEAADKAWREGVARHYTLDELDAMCTWLDTNLALNQSRIEAVSNRIGIVFAVDGLVISVLIATARQAAWPLTLIACLLAGLSMGVAASGLRTERLEDRDPTTTYATMWGRPRLPGEVQVVLYRRRSVVYGQQRALLDGRVPALKMSSWIAAVSVGMTAAVALVSRVA